jgi:hypothetical protein
MPLRWPLTLRARHQSPAAWASRLASRLLSIVLLTHELQAVAHSLPVNGACGKPPDSHSFPYLRLVSLFKFHF